MLKQYLPKKPQKWGFKLWARCSLTGFLHVFDIYQGKNAAIEDERSVSGCGLGRNVVLKLCSNLLAERNFKIFADNFFSKKEDCIMLVLLTTIVFMVLLLYLRKSLKKSEEAQITVLLRQPEISLWFDGTTRSMSHDILLYWK